MAMAGTFAFGPGLVAACAAMLAAGCDQEPVSGMARSDATLAAATSPVDREDVAAARIHFNWQMNCQGCHGTDGTGNEARDVPDLVALERFQRLPAGRDFLIRVPGMARSPLSDEDLTELANWMMGEFATPGVPHDWQPYSTAEVAALRKRPIIDGIVEHRARLITKIEGIGG